MEWTAQTTQAAPCGFGCISVVSFGDATPACCTDPNTCLCESLRENVRRSDGLDPRMVTIAGSELASTYMSHVEAVACASQLTPTQLPAAQRKPAAVLNLGACSSNVSRWLYHNG